MLRNFSASADEYVVNKKLVRSVMAGDIWASSISENQIESLLMDLDFDQKKSLLSWLNYKPQTGNVRTSGNGFLK